MRKCRICNAETKPIISFGRMPIANGFISKVKDDELFYDLTVCFCPECLMVQLGETVNPELMFNENYHFISSTSNAMSEHFQEMAKMIMKVILPKESPFVVELGCNDGIMLKHIAAKGISHIGIEPSRNVAELARGNGVRVVEKFFNQDAVGEIVEKYGQADIICGANVMCHIQDLNSVFEAINILLKRDGILFFEDPYLLDIIKKSSFDQIYDEHVYYFCGHSISELAKRHNMQLVDMMHQDVHGGSMRYYIKKGDSNAVTDRVGKYLLEEKTFNLHKIDGYLNLKQNIDKICRDLKTMLAKIREEGNRIAGYGATSKSTTLLNYAKIGPEIIDYISDITPTKINKYTPGTHIPIKTHEFFTVDSPPYVLLFAWNHKQEIFEKEREYRNKGGKFITYFPQVLIE